MRHFTSGHCKESLPPLFTKWSSELNCKKYKTIVVRVILCILCFSSGITTKFLTEAPFIIITMLEGILFLRITCMQHMKIKGHLSWDNAYSHVIGAFGSSSLSAVSNCFYSAEQYIFHLVSGSE